MESPQHDLTAEAIDEHPAAPETAGGDLPPIGHRLWEGTRGSMLCRTARAAKFDQLFDLGRQAILEGTHEVDAPPAEDGRWGISVVLRPEEATAGRLAAMTNDLMAIAGPWHWPTGAPSSAHFTVRALEYYRAVIPVGDARTGRYRAAVRAAATRCHPVELHLHGLTLTRSAVLACAQPTTGAADRFSAVLRAELGEDRWLEETFRGDIWYATLVHFTGPVQDPAGVVDLVERNRLTDFGVARFSQAELIRARYNGYQMKLVPLAAAPFAGHRSTPTAR